QRGDGVFDLFGGVAERLGGAARGSFGCRQFVRELVDAIGSAKGFEELAGPARGVGLLFGGAAPGGAVLQARSVLLDALYQFGKLLLAAATELPVFLGGVPEFAFEALLAIPRLGIGDRRALVRYTRHLAIDLEVEQLDEQVLPVAGRIVEEAGEVALRENNALLEVVEGKAEQIGDPRG